eukprot:jgi/Botrbrau1/19690/Bobra.0003s0051.1
MRYFPHVVLMILNSQDLPLLTFMMAVPVLGAGVDCNKDHAREFLTKYMPDRDRNLPAKFLDRNIDLAFLAWESQPWLSTVPCTIFLNNVLPYANVDEPREEWRTLLQKLVAPLIANCTSISEAALVVNQQLWELWDPPIRFKPNQTPDILSPSQVIAARHASCTGLSVFLVDALRSVGIPSRLAGIPAWNTPEGGNHDWVEVWHDGAWSFTGAAEWTPAGWNSTWFYPEPAKRQIPGDRMHSIWATSWKTTADGTFPLSWAPDDNFVNGLDVTKHYLDGSYKLTLELTSL